LAWQRSWVWESDATLFASLVQTSPHSAKSHYGQALSLHREEKYIQALAAYDRALVIYPQYVDALFNRGALLLSMGRLDEAYDSYRLAAEKNPDYVKARRALAMIEVERGEVERGIERLKNVVAKQRGYIEASESLVLILWNIGRREEAESVLGEALRHNPSDEQLHRLWGKMRQGGSR
jgi:tetratricopeptide (TPR) repeat protein